MRSSIFSRLSLIAPPRADGLSRLRPVWPFPRRLSFRWIKEGRRLAPAVACAVLLVLVGVQVWHPTGEARQQSLSPARVMVDGGGAAADEVQDWPQILSRPLFSPDRRPSLQSSKPSSLDGFVVTGIAYSPQAVVLVLKSPTGKSLRLLPGHEVEGWTLQAVQPDRVLFRRAEETASLSLDTKKLRSVAKGGDKAKGGGQ